MLLVMELEAPAGLTHIGLLTCAASLCSGG